MGTPEYTLPHALDLFHAIGLDGAEIVVQDGYQCAISQQAKPGELAALRRQADRLGLRIIALTPYYSRFNDLDPVVREAEIQGVCRVIQYAQALDSLYIRIYAGNGFQTVQEAGPGVVCAVTGLEGTYSGQGLGYETASVLPVLEPVLTYRVLPPAACDVHGL